MINSDLNRNNINKNSHSGKRLKVLILAAACHPDLGSEPGMGWAWVEALSDHHNLWVITGEYMGNREAIERILGRNPGLKTRLNIFYIPWFVPRKNIVSRLFIRLWYPLYYFYYRGWHQKAFQLAKNLQKDIRFDVAHQLNMIGYREPGFLWKLDVPFVWGPVGGTQNVPLRFIPLLGKETFWHLGRTLINIYQLRFNQRVRKAIAHSDAFVTATSDTHDAFLKTAGKDSFVINPNVIGKFIDLTCNYRGIAGEPKSSSPLRLVWSGLHVSRKALPIVLRALALLPNGCAWHLDIIGEGLMTPTWKKLSRELGVAHNCTWHGWLNRDQALEVMAEGEVFVFPSLLEGTPTVIMEAMAFGLPIICLDHCGMADVVSEECGIKIGVTTPNQVIREFANTIEALSRNPEYVKRLSEGAVKRVKHLAFGQIQAMCQVYHSAIENWRNGCRDDSVC